MTIKDTKAIKLGEPTSNIEYYMKVKAEIDRLEATKAILVQAILESFEAMGNPDYYDTPSNLRARVVKGKVQERISVKEARNLLPQNLFDKLLQVTQNKPYVMVQKLK